MPVAVDNIRTKGTKERLEDPDGQLTIREQRFCNNLVSHPERSDGENWEEAFGNPTNPGKVSRVKNSAAMQSYLKKLREQIMTDTAITAEDLLRELEEARQAALHGNLTEDKIPESMRKDKKMLAAMSMAIITHTPQASAAVSATMAKARILGLDKVIVKATVNFSDDLSDLMDQVASQVEGADGNNQG